MPIYEFKCSACGHEKEILMVKSSDWKGSHKLGCDKCKGMYKKVMSVPSDPVVHGYNAGNSYSNKKAVKGERKNKGK